MSAPDVSMINIQPDYDSLEFWEGTKQHKFLIRQCQECGFKFYPTYSACPKCASMKLGWFQTNGKGVIFSYFVAVQPILAAFVNAVPYVVALVELPDCANSDGSAVRVGALMIDGEDKVAIGLPVKVVFEAPVNAEKYQMPRWQVTGSAPDAWKFPW